jgi:hypothetical protein
MTKKIIAPGELMAEHAIRGIDEMLNASGFPSYLFFVTGAKGGWVSMYSPNEQLEAQLKAQIVRSLKQKPELAQFFRDVLSKL